MAISITELQQLRDDAVRNKAAGVVNVRFSDGRETQYVTSQDQWQKIIADLDSAIQSASGIPGVRFTLATFSRD